MNPAQIKDLADELQNTNFASKDVILKTLYTLVKCEGDVNRTAEVLDKHPVNVQRNLKRAQQIGANAGYVPEKGLSRGIIPGQRLKGASIFTETDEGEKVWLKYEEDKKQKEKLFKQWVEGLAEDIRGLSQTGVVPKSLDSDYLTTYTLTDAHIGLLAWHEDADENWDTKKGYWVHSRAIDLMMQKTHKSETAVVALCGDIAHNDNQKNVTPGHGHQLDVDGRYDEIQYVAAKMAKETVEKAKKKHKFIKVVVVAGNHDPATTAGIRTALRLFFEEDERVEVVSDSHAIHHMKFGNNILAFTHGHKPRPNKIIEALSADIRTAYDCREVGNIHCLHGHIHHKSMFEESGILVESLRTMVAPDEHSVSSGYRSQRDLQAFTYHKDYLMVDTNFVTRRMVKLIAGV